MSSVKAARSAVAAPVSGLVPVGSRAWAARARGAYLDWDWFFVVVASWLLPLLGFNVWAATYLHSELFWILPIVSLLPRFFHETHPGSRRRRAFFTTVGIILASGSLLDLAFGRWILTFGPGPYWAVWAGIPVEEFIFYLLGPIAMLLVYFWAAEHFLGLLNPQAQRLGLDASGLGRFSPGLAAQALALLLAGVALKAWLGAPGPWLPLYYCFLVLTAYLPLILFWKAVRPLVHWPALTLTVLYTLVTSILWEPSLALPLRWWGYQPGAMLGLWVRAWRQAGGIDLPVEAVSVWLVAPFACVFFFEVIKALHYHPARGLGAKLWGGPPAAPPTQPRRARRSARRAPTGA